MGFCCGRMPNFSSGTYILNNASMEHSAGACVAGSVMIEDRNADVLMPQ